MRETIAFIIILTYVVFGTPEWLADGGVVCALTYPLFHANVFHLLVNILSMMAIYRRRRGNVMCLVLSYAVSVFVYPLSPRPVVGISNILFATSGMRTPALGDPWWRSGNVLLFLFVMVLFLFVPSVSAITHIVSFLAGVLMACIRRSVKSTMEDVKRVERIG